MSTVPTCPFFPKGITGRAGEGYCGKLKVFKLCASEHRVMGSYFQLYFQGSCGMKNVTTVELMTLVRLKDVSLEVKHLT